jgi:hypothetical protein
MGQRGRKRRLSAEERDARARAELEPLEPGERPRAVTVAATVALVMAMVNSAVMATGRSLGGDEGDALFTGILMNVVLVIAALGMWRARYWAVLGFQALLALQILVLTLFVLLAARPIDMLYAIPLVVGLGALFFKLVGAMARIQLPERGRRPDTPDHR